MPGAPVFEIHGNMVRKLTKFTHKFIGPRNAPIFSLNNGENCISPPD